MPLPQKQLYTEADYYALPEDVRAELIDGQIHYQAATSRAHQEILMEVSGTIRDYIKSKGGSCRVYPAPFAVQLSIFVYHLEKDNFKAVPYTFRDKIKVNIYDDLWIDFQEITL